ncbi:MAG: tetratricopeptide repeat protein [Pirellulaceae bacterium]|nr:tetratricopeptide repeat protein [Pirellulaceae bacterium]
MATLEQELLRGWALHQQKKFAEAEGIYRRVIAQAKDNANAWCYLGIALHDQRQFEQSIAAYRQALMLQPNFPVALNNLGNSLRYTSEIDEADRCFEQAIQQKPDYLNAYKNRGTLHVWTGDIARGLHWYEQALKINPNEAELHRNLGVIYLLQGRFEDGWREYRWRWQVGDLHRPNISAPVWDGSDPKGKTILLCVEQGLGDTLNFVRFARWLRERGAQTVVHCQAALLALLQQSPALGPMYPNTLALETRVHTHCSLLDVADFLNVNAETIPSFESYIQPAPNLTQYWAQRLPKQNDRLRVGIAWQGTPDHQADIFRSIPLKHFEALADLPKVELYSLQSGFGVEQIAQWRGAAPLRNFGDNVDQSSGAFMDTAAIMRQLDLVITSDTSIAHLAGALGVKCWIALNYIPDWRWLLARSDSPWYPSVRLFRQPTLSNWQAVFQEMRQELLEFSR